MRPSEHFFFEVGHFTDFLRTWLSQDVATTATKAKLAEWLDADEGLRPWDISRDAPYFGFPIPGQPGKYFYVWLDAPIGYLSSFKNHCARVGADFDTLMSAGSGMDMHHFIGKDIVNFHGLFWPAVLHGCGFTAPTQLHVNGYLMVNGEKMSKSRGTFIMARTYLDCGLDPEALRYYFAAKSSGAVDDVDLNLTDFVTRVNADVVGKFVNLASRCAGFITKRFDGRLSEVLHDPVQHQAFVETLPLIRGAYARDDVAGAIRLTMGLADEANRYIDTHKPWVMAKTDGQEAELQSVCTQGLNLFYVLARALAPILPRTCHEAARFLNAPKPSWENVDPLLGSPIAPYQALFTRVDPHAVAAMVEASRASLAPAAKPPSP